MEFIEMSGKTLLGLLNPEEYQADDLRREGLTDESVVRINRQGDIELRREAGWDVIGGLLGDFAHRIQEKTGLKWCKADD